MSQIKSPIKSIFRFGVAASLGLVATMPVAVLAAPDFPPVHMTAQNFSQKTASGVSGPTANGIAAAPVANQSVVPLTSVNVPHTTTRHHATRHHPQRALRSHPTHHSPARHAPTEASDDPRDRVNAANHAARVQPQSQTFANAIQQYPYSDGALYQLYASPGEVTDIALQEGEQLAGTGPVAAGDTVRWIIGDTTSGTGASTRVHILVKPTRADLVTNLVINTDRRTYHLELHATPSTYMASLSWSYPQDQLIAIRRASVAAARAAPIADGIDMDALHFGYAISGDKPSWRPLRAFDDGTHVYIDFPDSIAQNDMPPLFVLGDKGQAELVNYRVSGHHLIVDRLFKAAELRLGDKHRTQTVRISHTNPKAG